VLCLGECEQRGRAATEDSQKNQQHSYTRKQTFDIFSFKIFFVSFFLLYCIYRLKKHFDAIGQPGANSAIRFISVGAKSGIYTIVGPNGTLIEAKTRI
jgi:hypothetical protein